MSVGEFLQGGGPAGAAVWGGDVGGVAKNGAGAELLHPWGRETYYREAAAERVVWEIVLTLTCGSHEGSRVHRRQEIYKQKAEHGHTVHFNATASGPLRVGDAVRRGKGNNEMVGPEGNRLVEGKSEGSGDGIGVRIGDRNGRGGNMGRRKQGKRLEWGRMERRECRRM